MRWRDGQINEMNRLPKPSSRVSNFVNTVVASLHIRNVLCGGGLPTSSGHYLQLKALKAGGGSKAAGASTMATHLEDQMKAMMSKLDRPGSVEGVTTGLKPTDPKKQARRGRHSRDLLGTSEFHEGTMEDGLDAEDEDDSDPTPVAARQVAPGPAVVSFRSGVTPKVVRDTVDMGHQGLKDADAAAIASMLNTASVPIAKLTLADNDLGDAAAEVIAEQLKTNKSITYLSLHKNKIGDRGGKALAQALAEGCPSLTTLFVTGNPLSAEARSAITKAYDQRPAESKAPPGSLNALVIDGK